MQTLPIYVISLKHAIERRKNFVDQMRAHNLAFQFFDAIDGRTMGNSEISQVYDSEANSKRFKRPLSKPEIGCYLSHLKLWQTIVQSDDNAAIILEDDINVLEPLSGLIGSLDKLALEDVFIKLDAPICAPSGGAGQMLEDPFWIYQPKAIATAAMGYVIGRRAAGRMSVVRARFFRPVDNDVKHFWEHQVPVHHIAPRVIGENSKVATASYIDRARLSTKGNPVSRFVRHLRYQSHVMKHRLKRQPTHLIASREPS